MTESASLAAQLEALAGGYSYSPAAAGMWARTNLPAIITALRADNRCAELEAENARLRSELNAASDVILLAVKNAPDWAQLAHAFHERRKALENRDG